MDTNTLSGQWKQLRGKVQEKWGKLTNDDLDQIDGQRDQLIGKLQERYGRERDELSKEVDTFYSGNSQR